MTIHSMRLPIMLIEDNPVDLDLTLRAFENNRLANPLLVARDGEEALAWVPRWEAGETPPAMILLDLNLPRISGLDVLRAFKAHPLLRTIPVVVLTSSRESRDIRAAYELGSNSYILKPVDFDKFVSVVANIEMYWLVVNTHLDPFDGTGKVAS